MQTYADQVIDALGGTTAVATAIDAPTSTVHSWRKMGIPSSRLAHLKLLAEKARIELPTPPAEEEQAAA
jgi:hypothetical protein